MPKIVILTGAGISAESGIRTFRDQNGLWEDHRIEDVASPEGFARNPDLVHSFYNARRNQLLSKEIRPNPAHLALARLEREWKGEFLLVTQNVDDLHIRAGSKKVLPMHGELLKARCRKTQRAHPWRSDLGLDTSCVDCGSPGCLRPHIVWFGEIPFGIDEIHEAVSGCSIFAAIGTSGQVYPAAGLVRLAPLGARKIEVNLVPSSISSDFDEKITGQASIAVPELVDRLLSLQA